MILKWNFTTWIYGRFWYNSWYISSLEKTWGHIFSPFTKNKKLLISTKYDRGLEGFLDLFRFLFTGKFLLFLCCDTDACILYHIKLMHSRTCSTHPRGATCCWVMWPRPWTNWTTALSSPPFLLSSSSLASQRWALFPLKLTLSLVTYGNLWHPIMLTRTSPCWWTIKL